MEANPSQPSPGSNPPIQKPASTADGPKPDVGYDDFAKLDLQIARVLTCVPVAGADKLYQLEVEIDGGVKRTVVSGIRPWYQPEQLIGTEVVYFANLVPKKLRGVISHGMILAGHAVDGAAVLLRPEKPTFAGAKVS